MFFDNKEGIFGEGKGVIESSKVVLTMFLGRRFNDDIKMSSVLMSMYGFSRWFVGRLFCRFGLPWNVRVNVIPGLLLTGIEESILHSKVLRFGKSLRNSVRDRLERYMTLKTYRGLRFLQSLPMRGQRSKTNARTMKRMSRKVFSVLEVRRRGL